MVDSWRGGEVQRVFPELLDASAEFRHPLRVKVRCVTPLGEDVVST